jgi:hypothetical protein
MLAFGGCTDDPVSPAASDELLLQPARRGSGLVLESVTGVALPLIGHLGNITIEQAVIEEFAIIENTVGQIVGLEVEGVLTGIVDVLGTDVVTENFNTTVAVTSSGFGQCDLVTIDLAPINIDVLGIAGVDVPAASVVGRGSGVVGSLLCNLGSLLSGLLGGGVGSPGAAGVVNALNNQI